VFVESELDDLGSEERISENNGIEDDSWLASTPNPLRNAGDMLQMRHRQAGSRQRSAWYVILPAARVGTLKTTSPSVALDS
jgi:hypothetical protein